MSFFIAKKAGRRNPIEEKNLRNHYDRDGCYSLLIAIILNVGASKAWSLYERGRNQSDCGTSQSSNPDRFKSRRQTLVALKQKGYSNEVIAEYLNCDPSTVRRKLKEWRKEENDEPSRVC